MEAIASHFRRARKVALFAATGAMAGLLAVVYSALLDALTRLAQGGLLGFSGQAFAGMQRPWMLPVLTTLVGTVTGFLVIRLTPGAVSFGGRGGEGVGKGTTDGTDAMIAAFHHGQGRVKPLAAILRTVTSLFTLSFGASAGKEGPVAFMGAGFGSWLAERFSLSERERRTLLLAGAAGGLGAIFRAPLGAAMTAVEVLYSEDFEGEALLPSVVSAVSAYAVFILFNGAAPYLDAANLAMPSLQETPFYLLLAGACAGTAWLYVRGFFFIKYKMFARIFTRMGLPAATGLGGLAMGVVGMLNPGLIGDSHTSLQAAMLGQVPAMALFMLLVGKIVATSITIGSGFSGGMFGPGLFVGGMTGGLVGKLCQAVRPDLHADQGAFVMVGMSAFFACAAKAPIGPMIMVCEITQGYALLAPLMFVTAVALLLSGDFGLYENQLRVKMDSPAHRGESAEAALKQLTVADVYAKARVVVEECTTLEAIRDILEGTDAQVFAVRSDTGRITGLLHIKDVRKVLFKHDMGRLLVAGELARPPVLLTPSQDLFQALLAFAQAKAEELPVVAPEDPDHVIGSLTVGAVLAAHRA